MKIPKNGPIEPKMGANTNRPLSSVALDFENSDPTDLTSPHLYINRELGWLEFNQRVLDQAFDKTHPLLERVKFLAIVGANLDEFSMIRVATLLKKFRANMDDITPDGLTTRQQLDLIRKRTKKMREDQNKCWTEILRPELEVEGIHFVEPATYTPQIEKYLKDYFKRQIYPILTPLGIDPGHPFPHISNLSLNFAVVVQTAGQIKFARLKIPHMLPRFILLPEKTCGRLGYNFAFIEDVIRKHIGDLFPDTPLVESALFRVTRDTDIVIEEDEAHDLLESVGQSLKQLKYGAISFLEVEESMSQRVLELLTENFDVATDVISRTPHRMGFSDWWELMDIHRPKLKYPPFSPGIIFDKKEPETIFERIRYQDYLIHHPYDSFASVETFLKAAVEDPNVLGIKMTLYRLGTNSPIVEHLIKAAEADKQVTVLVELKARFDEKNNIAWAKRLEDVGVHVVYGLLNLKTHCKLCCVLRQEPDGIRRYIHLGTGNYNPVTAKSYTDLGLFTANESIADDVSQVFNYLTGYSAKTNYATLLVSPVNLRSKMHALIEREAEHARMGKSARIIIKNNGVADPQMVQALYRASQAGVKIDMIVRGVCTLRPGIKKISENISVSSIVGRFLEHSRIYFFQNGGLEEIYIGSADLMERNLDRRVETLCPILDENIKLHLKNVVLETLLKENDRAHTLSSNGHYRKVTRKDTTPVINAQEILLNHYISQNKI